MSAPVSSRDFDKLYQDAVRAVFRHWTERMQREIAAHCHAWGPGLFDFETYLRASSIRFYKAYRAFADVGAGPRVCDVGGFWGVFPVTLKSLGYDVTMTESLKYYGGSFDALFNFIADAGVSVLDFDPFEPDAALPARFDVVTVMAVLEHYPHSLKPFMKNVISILQPRGKLYLEVPNIAFWPKRIDLLLGRTPQSPLADIYESEVPFIGHHHEFTINELRDLARRSGLSILRENFYNYSPGTLVGSRLLLLHPLQLLAFYLLRDSRECLAILCELKNQSNIP